MPAISEADRNLAGAARGEGAKVTDVQVASWREQGLIDKPRQVHLGRPGGSRAVYPPEALDQVIAFAGLPRKHRNAVGLFVLFAQGQPVSESAFKAELIVWLASTLAVAGNSDDEITRAEQLAVVLREVDPALAERVEGRFVYAERQRLKRDESARPGESPAVLREGVATTAALTMMTGEAPSEDATLEVITAAGIARLAGDPERSPHRIPLVDDVDAEQISLTIGLALGDLAGSIDRASMSRLHEIRHALLLAANDADAAARNYRAETHHSDWAGLREIARSIRRPADLVLVCVALNETPIADLLIEHFGAARCVASS